MTPTPRPATESSAPEPASSGLPTEKRERTDSRKAPSGRLPGLRWWIFLGCLGLIVWHVVELRAWHDNRRQLGGLLEEYGLEDFNQTALRRISRERAPHQAKLIAARTIVHQVMSPDLDARGMPILPRERQVEALEVAEGLARQALEDESESWQASMLVGASIYLRRSLAADRRLITEPESWEAPLRRAVDAAASKTEPRRILAAAYLETWSYLSADKKALTRQLLQQVFRHDEQALRRLAPVWLQLVDDEEEALSVVPDNVIAWQLIKYLYGRALDWSAYANAHRRFLDVLDSELTADLDEAESRRQLGDDVGSRELCLQVIEQAPRQMRFVPYVVRALEIYPPGLQGLRPNEGVLEWLRWAVALDAVEVNPLPAKTIDDLMTMASDLETPVAAHAALLANNVYNMRLFERQSAHKLTREWSSFLLAKARRLAESGAVVEAQEALDDLHLASRNTYRAWQVRALMAEQQEEPTALAVAETEMQSFADRRWLALAWDLRQTSPQLFFVSAVAARGVRLEVVEAGPRGDVVSVLIDGEEIAVRAVDGGEHHELKADIEPGPHLLQIVSVSGQPTALGSVELID